MVKSVTDTAGATLSTRTVTRKIVDRRAGICDGNRDAVDVGRAARGEVEGAQGSGARHGDAERGYATFHLR